MKLTIALATALIALTACTPSIPQHARRCSVTLTTDGSGGTGTLFRARGRAYVIAAAHVVEDIVGIKNGKQTFGAVTIRQRVWGNGRLSSTISSPAKVLAYSQKEAEDIVLLEVQRGWLFPEGARLTTRPLVQGESVQLVGSFSHPTVEHLYARGIVGAVRRRYRGNTYDYIIAGLRPGASGAGVYNAQGRYVGMFTRGAGCNIGLCVPAYRIHKWLASVGYLWVVE